MGWCHQLSNLVHNKMLAVDSDGWWSCNGSCCLLLYFVYRKLLCDSLICGKSLFNIWCLAGCSSLWKEFEGFTSWFWRTQVMEQLGCTYLKSYWILLMGAKYHTLRLSDGSVRRLEFFLFCKWKWRKNASMWTYFCFLEACNFCCTCVSIEGMWV